MDPAALAQTLRRANWNLAYAREIARAVESREPQALHTLVAAIASSDIEVRKRAADVARRITERSSKPLWRFADELAGLLTSLDPDERRTRWHLGLVVARVAHTREQRLRAAAILERMSMDEGNEVRCSAIEGIAQLASVENSLVGLASEIIDRALRYGSTAERCRAKKAAAMLDRSKPRS